MAEHFRLLPYSNNKVLLELQTAEKPHTGSMNDEAALANASDKEQLGFSVLDIVKHSVRTIIQILGPKDRLSIVSYSTEAKVAFPLGDMDEKGKKAAEEALKKLKPEGHTNLWGGLETGLDVLKNKSGGDNSLSAIMLLTDGMPNIVPDEGHLSALRQYRKDHPFDCIINTFGFGYTLDSQLLHDIAIEGNGSYGFIPDSSFVGTIFINALSNLLATYSPQTTLEITPAADSAVTKLSGVAEPPTTSEAVSSGPSDVELDLVFIVDCTGSMSSYIREAQNNIKSIVDQIMTSERANVRFALVSYRDHPPQDRSYVTQVFKFSDDQDAMKSAVDTMSASGGGDVPEALATGMSDALDLDYRTESTKVAILITDAPPHGLGESGDGFPEGEPNGVDPLDIAAKMAAKGIALYAVGCEPAILGGRAPGFMRSIAKITGGKYVPLQDYRLLSTAIIGSCREELSLYRAALPILRAIESSGNSQAVEELKKKGISVNALHFEDPNQGAYEDEVECFVSSKNLSQARAKLSKVPKVSVRSDQKLKVSVKEGDSITSSHIDRVVDRYAKSRSKLEERDAAMKQRKANAQNASHNPFGLGKNGATVTVNTLGPLFYGQPRTVLVEVSSSAGVTATITFTDTNGNKSRTLTSSLCDPSKESDFHAKFHYFRSKFIDVVESSMKVANDDIATAQKNVSDLITELKAYVDGSDDEKAKALLEDVEGQVAEAFSRADWFKKWGVHYLPSLLRAHQLQICNNFKDPGVQQYGGQIFSDQRDVADEAFIKLPPPEASLLPPPPPPSTTSTSTVSHARVESMSMYYDSRSVCFAGTCTVELENGETKPLSSLKKGDVLSSPSGPAKVACVVRSHIANGETKLVKIGDGLLVTPYHPISLTAVGEKDKWVFPCEVAPAELMPAAEVYNLVLESSHIAFVNGVKCVTLGHGFTGETVAHDYFGSSRVVEDLKSFKGWEDGRVDVYPESVVRSLVDSSVCKLVPFECSRS